MKNSKKKALSILLSIILILVFCIPPEIHVHAATVDKPSFSGGLVIIGQSITLSCTTEGAEIYYTTDDSAPYPGGTLYTGPIQVNQTFRLRAVACKDGSTSDELKTYINAQLPTPTANVAYGSAVLRGSTVSLTDTISDAALYYVFGGNIPGASDTLYTTPLTITEAVRIRVIAIKSGFANSGILTLDYTIAKAATPTANPASGAVSAGTAVALISTTSGATIRYTTDGTDPTTSSPIYTNPISVNSAMTIKAIAYKDDTMDPSSAMSAAYTVFSAPGSPKSLNATTGNSQAVLTWAAPDSNGGSNITKYQVQKNGDSDWTDVGTNLTYTFSGLTNGSQYTLYVRAVNAAGAGTSASTTVTPVLSHTHDFGTGWVADAGNHWHECACRQKADEAVHTEDSGTVTTQPTEYSTGIRTYKCHICQYVMRTEEVAKLLPNEASGNVTQNTVLGSNTPPAVIATDKNNLIQAVLTLAERQQLLNGTDIEIIFSVEDASSSVSPEDKEAVNTRLGDHILGQFLDINLHKVMGGGVSIRITVLNETIQVVLDIPESLKNDQNRTFGVIRVHNGETVLLTDQDNNPDTITIDTDRFSTYAIVYQDQINLDPPGIVENQTVDTVTNKVATDSSSTREMDSEPKTGDTSLLEIYASVAMVAGLTYLLLYFGGGQNGMSEAEKKRLVSKLSALGKRGGRFRKYAVLTAIFVLLVYYHSIGKQVENEWQKEYDK